MPMRGRGYVAFRTKGVVERVGTSEKALIQFFADKLPQRGV